MCDQILDTESYTHNCNVGFSLGQTRPDMIPDLLYNEPWWTDREEMNSTTLIKSSELTNQITVSEEVNSSY